MKEIFKNFTTRPGSRSQSNQVEALKKMAKAYYLVLGKTGIATLGLPRLIDVIPSPQIPMRSGLLLKIAASAEQNARHVLAKGILEKLPKATSLITPHRFTEFPGLGVEAYLTASRIHVGNRRLMSEKFVQLNALQDRAEKHEMSGHTVLYVAIDGVFAGLLVMEDEPRLSLRRTITDLHGAGITVALMTSDHRKTAEAIAERLGIERVISDISHEQKSAEMNKLLRDDRYLIKLGGPSHHRAVGTVADVSILCQASGEENPDFHFHIKTPEDIAGIFTQAGRL